MFLLLLQSIAGLLTPEVVSHYQTDLEKGKIIFQNSFESGEKALDLKSPNVTVKHTFGLNGSGGLCYERKDPAEYRLAVVKLPQLKAQRNYELSYFFRTEDLVNHQKERSIGGLCVFYNKNRKYLTGVYAFPKGDTSFWRKEVLSIQVPEDGLDVRLAFYLRRGYTGKVYFDDLVLKNAGSTLSVIPLLPDRMLFRKGHEKLVFKADKAVPKHVLLLLEVIHGNRTEKFLLSSRNHLFEKTLPDLKPGKVIIRASLADPKEKKIIYKTSFTFQCQKGSLAPVRGGCYIDPYGRSVIDGKLFFPLGIFGDDQDTSLQKIADARFNVVALYASMGFRRGKRSPAENFRAHLDRIHSYGLKTIFSLKDQRRNNRIAVHKLGPARTLDDVTRYVVDSLKTHPGLLAWYISDEASRSEIGELQRLRQIVSFQDPHHPVLSLTNSAKLLPHYGASGDIISVDPYPISGRPVKQSLLPMLELLRAAQESGCVLWTVPQIFTWAIHPSCKLKKGEKPYFPTQEELIAMPLLAGLFGARGFIFYSGATILLSYEKRWKGSREREWEKVKNMGKLLHRLSPYFLGKERPQFLPVQQKQKESVFAGIMTSDKGKKAVFVIGTGSKVSGKFKLPAGKWRSYTGRTKALPGNEWIFSADKIDYDILLPEGSW